MCKLILGQDSYTSKKIIESIENDPESRRECLPAGKAGMLFMFKRAAIKHKRNTSYQFWTHENGEALTEGNHAEEIYSDKFIEQKLEYIHNNQVEAKIVQYPEDYLYSSARNYAGLDAVMDCNILTTTWKTVK